MDRAVGTASSTAGKGILTGWEYAPGDRTSGEIAWFTAAPGTGWALSDGGAGTRTTATAGTAAFTTPNLIGAYPKGAAAYTGAVVPAANGTVSGATAAEASHTHTVYSANSPTSATDTGPLEVQYVAGSPNTAARSNHIHYVDLPAATSSAGS